MRIIWIRLTFRVLYFKVLSVKDYIHQDQYFNNNQVRLGLDL